MRANDFKENRPENRVERDLPPGRRVICRAQAQPSLHQQQRRQRARDKQHIVEMESHERVVRMRFDQPAIQRVKRTTNQTESVPDIPKFFHSNAMIAKPKAAATSSL